MIIYPAISPQARKLLEIIASDTSVDGSTLMKRMGAIDKAGIVTSIRELQKLQLIEVGGKLTEDGLPFARVGVRPSSKGFLSNLLQNTD